MKVHFSVLLLAGILLVGGLAVVLSFGGSSAMAAPGSTGTPESLRMMRPGYLYSATKVAAGAASASTGEFSVGEVLRVICTVDAWVDQGGSAVAAVADEHFVPAYEPLWIRTYVGYTYLAALRVGSTTGTCYISVVR